MATVLRPTEAARVDASVLRGAPIYRGSRIPERVPSILLVEDHRDTRAMYSEFLRAGFEILEAGDGPLALCDEVLAARLADGLLRLEWLGGTVERLLRRLARRPAG